MTELVVQLPESDGQSVDGSDWDVNGRQVGAWRGESKSWRVSVFVTELSVREAGLDLTMTVELELPPDEMERVCVAALAAVRDARYRMQADEIGCDFTVGCTAGETHMADCLGAYRTQAEVDAGVFPSESVLETRQHNELSTRAHARAVSAKYSGGA